MKVISSNLPKGRFETCPYPVLLPLHGVVKANWYYYFLPRNCSVSVSCIAKTPSLCLSPGGGEIVDSSSIRFSE